jgi:hypothetical protein
MRLDRHDDVRYEYGGKSAGTIISPKLAQGTHDSRSTESHYLAEETQRWR